MEARGLRAGLDCGRRGAVPGWPGVTFRCSGVAGRSAVLRAVPSPEWRLDQTTKEKGRADAGAESHAGAEPDAAGSSLASQEPER